MQHYILAKALQQIYKIDVYITRRMFHTLKLYIQLDNHLPIAEESLCGFEKFYTVEGVNKGATAIIDNSISQYHSITPILKIN